MKCSRQIGYDEDATKSRLPAELKPKLELCLFLFRKEKRKKRIFACCLKAGAIEEKTS